MRRLTTTAGPDRPAAALGPRDEGGPVLVVVADGADVLRLAPVAARLGERAELVHVGPVWDGPAVERFLGAVGCPRPGWFVALGERGPGDRFGQVTRVLDRIVAEQRPAAAVVHGATSGAIGAAFACASAGIPLVRLGGGRHPRRAARADRLARAVDHLASLCVVADDRELLGLLADGVAPERLLRAPRPLGDGLTACFAVIGAEPRAATCRAPVVVALDSAGSLRRPGLLLELLRCLGRAPAPALLVPSHEVAAELALPPGGSGQIQVVGDLDLVERAEVFAQARAAVCDSVEGLEELATLGRPVAALGAAAGAVRRRHRGCRAVREVDELELALDQVLDASPVVRPLPTLPTGGAGVVADAALALADHRPVLPAA